MDSSKWDYGLIFEKSADPQYIVDPASGRFLAVNEAFVKLAGYPREEITGESFSVQKLILPSDQEQYNTFYGNASNPEDRGDYAFSEFMMITALGRVVDVRVSACPLPELGENIIHGTLRDITAKKTLIKTLQQKAQKYGAERAQAVKTSVSMGKHNIQLLMQTEQIQKSYELTAKLLLATTEEEAFKLCIDILSDRNSFNYRNVSFWILDGEILRIFASNRKGETVQDVSINSDHRFAQALRGEKVELNSKTGEIIEVLQGYDAPIGLLHADLQQNPWELPTNMNIVRNLTSAISLAISNLRLYNTVKKQAIEDHLTGIFNRRYFDEKVRDEFERAQRYRRPLSLVMIDIDDFKKVNDTMGHEQGNIVLKELSAILKLGKRFSDIVCRYGGEEFFLILPETDFENAVKKAENVRVQISKYEFSGAENPEAKIHITASFGVAAITPEVKDHNTLVNLADQSLYVAKQGGKNMVSVCQAVKKV